MDDVDADFLVGELFKALAYRLNGALYVSLDDDLELLDLAELHLIEEVVERDLGAGVELGLLLLMLTLLDQLARQTLVGDGVEGIAAGGNVVQTGDLDRDRGAGFLDASALIVGHRAHMADRHAGYDDVAGAERTVLYEDGRHGASALIQTRLDDSTLRGTVGVGFELLHIGYQQYHLEQIVDAHTGLGGYGHAGRVAAPLLGDQLILGELLLDLLGIRARLIHFIDRDDDRDACRLRVVDRFYRLRHDTVICRYDEDRDIRHLSTAGTHGSERLMTRGIEEGDVAVVDVDAIRADVLGDTARLGVGDMRVADVVKQRGLTVVDVTHDNDDRSAVDQVIVGILAVVDDALFDGDDNFLLDSGVELHRDQGRGVKVNDVVRGDHRAHEEGFFDDLGDRRLEAQRQIADRDLVGDQDGHLLCLTLLLDTRHTLALGLALCGAAVALLGALVDLLLLG